MCGPRGKNPCRPGSALLPSAGIHPMSAQSVRLSGRGATNRPKRHTRHIHPHKNPGGAAIKLNRPGIYPLHRANLHASIEGCARFRTQKGSHPRPGHRGEIQISAAVHFRANPPKTAFSAFWSNSACSANCPGSLPASVMNCRDAPSPPSGSDLTETPLFFPGCRS